MSLRLYVTDKKRYVATTRAKLTVYCEVFGKHYPAMALLVVAGLLKTPRLSKIEAIAAIP